MDQIMIINLSRKSYEKNSKDNSSVLELIQRNKSIRRREWRNNC